MYGLIAQPTCPLRHSVKSYQHLNTDSAQGEWVRGEDEDFGFLIQGDGRGKYRMRCRRCGHRSTDVPRQVIQAWGLISEPFAWVEIKPANTYQPCSCTDCPEPGVEYHHFAPRNTFGEDADRWPVLPLCRTHHREWHTKMDGYRWHQKAAA